MNPSQQIGHKVRARLSSIFHLGLHSTDRSNSPKFRWTDLLLAVYVLVVAVSIVKKAWIYEDAYITFRTIENFFNGFGLRWNPDERVQTYTHPLWLFLHIPLEYFFRNLHVVNLLLSIVLSSAAFALALGKSLMIICRIVSASGPPTYSTA